MEADGKCHLCGALTIDLRCADPDCSTHLRRKVARLERERKAMEAALRRAVEDFEGDYVLGGVIVGDPPSPMREHYEIFKDTLAGLESAK